MRRHDGGPAGAADADRSVVAGTLDAAIGQAFESLRRSLTLHPLGPDTFGADRFRVDGAPGQFERTFGGLLVAQALAAATATVAGMTVSSLHAYFAAAGVPEEPATLSVVRVRDGRTMATREVSMVQNGRPLLAMIASFHRAVGGPELVSAPAGETDPTEVPRLQDWLLDAPQGLTPQGLNPERWAHWVRRPPAVEVRIAEPPTFIGGPGSPGRAHWMRTPAPVPDELQAVMLAYASDYLMMDLAMGIYRRNTPAEQLFGASLDHSIWFHRPVRYERWHRHTLDVAALTGERGLVRGSVTDDEGNLVASIAQEILVRTNQAAEKS